MDVRNYVINELLFICNLLHFATTAVLCNKVLQLKSKKSLMRLNAGTLSFIVYLSEK